MMKLNGCGDVNAVKEERRSQLVTQITQLEETCSNIGTMVGKLEEVLGPVLRVMPDSIQAKEEVPPPVLVMRAHQIRNLDSRFREILARLADLLDWLEV